jgi:chitin synthase
MLDGAKERKPLAPWVIFSRVVTFWAPGAILKRVGLPAKDMQQAWREKFALCFIIACIMAVVVFITLFLPIVFCPVSSQENANKTYAVAALPGAVARKLKSINFLIYTN